MPQCKAKSKQSGAQCGRMAAAGRDVCNIHGGKTPVGALAPTFKHGRYSKHLPTRLAATYLASEKDGELLALRGGVALMDARLEDLLARVDTGESGELWASVAKTIGAAQGARKALNAARRAGAGEKAKEKAQEAERDLTDALDAAELTVQAGVSDYAAWAEVAAVLEQRRRLTDSERKRCVEMQRMVDSKDLLTLLGALVGVIKSHVTDRDILSAICADIDRLVPG